MSWRCRVTAVLALLLHKWVGHALPESLSLVAALTLKVAPSEALLWPTALRLAWLLAEVSHGSAHTLVRAVVDRDHRLIRPNHLLEDRPITPLVAGLLPFAAIPLDPGSRGGNARLATGDPTPWKVRLKAAGALVLHLIVVVGSAALLLVLGQASAGQSWAAGALWAMLLANLWLMILSRSDWQMLVGGRGPWLYCGNFGLLTAEDIPLRGDLVSQRTIGLFQRMGRETELRGAQAGGGLVMAVDRLGEAAFVGEKIVNAKRGDLTPALEAAFRKGRKRARRSGWRRHPAGLMACWHYRFGTSGPPAIRETHWQEWSPARRTRIWQQQPDGLWQWHTQTVHHRITHNGDFEAYEAFGTCIDVGGQLGPWLEEALKQPAPAVVDSARIAGMMDLLICQGDWFAAVRWGYLSTMASYPTTCSAQALQRWASQFEEAFAGWAQGRASASGHRIKGAMADEMVARLLPGWRRDPLLSQRQEQDLETWVQASIECFLHHDPATAAQRFMDHARGSFGLVVISTTWPDRLVLCSLGQPLTVGFSPGERMALYASEPAAVDAILSDQPGSWRFDLDDNAGEIAVLSNSALQIYSLSLDRALTPEEQRARGLSYETAPSQGGSRSSRRGRRHDSLDPVGADIASIPSLLARIHDDWSNPGSANRQSADVLAQLLIAKAANLAAKEQLLRAAGLDESLSRSSQVDLLITGVENSLWLGEQFGHDLNCLMPRLTVRVLSANEVLKALQNDLESLELARQTIVLVLSHTARTFPSRQVMEACDLMVRRRVIREFFVISGEPENLLGSPMLQGEQPDTSGQHRLFTTGAGRRRSEPATATVVAMEQTLTQLLFSLSRQVLQAFPGGRPLGMRLSRETLARLEANETEALLQDSQVIVGANRQGEAQPSFTSRALERLGGHWAQHVLEAPWAWALQALYITISLELGMPLVQTVGRQLVGEALWNGAGSWSMVLRGLALGGDVLFYIFGPWFWTLLLRWFQGRPLLARLGRRTLVISETSWLHPLLTNYISKLFSLSFGITSLDIQGADGSDHLLHTHAHRVVRGTLLFFGIPDGRCGGRRQAEANAFLLTARQADGIRNWNTGPEMVAVGSDPALNHGPFRRAVVLPCATEGHGGATALAQDDALVERLRESRYGSVRRLLAGYVVFWSMARAVGMLPLLRFKWWRSQSRTRVMTTAAPVSAANLDLAEDREVVVLSLERVANREQS